MAYYLSNCIKKFTEAEAMLYMLCKSKCPAITTEYHHHISNCKYIRIPMFHSEWLGGNDYDLSAYSIICFCAHWFVSYCLWMEKL